MKLGKRLNFVTHSHEDRRSNYSTKLSLYNRRKD